MQALLYVAKYEAEKEDVPVYGNYEVTAFWLLKYCANLFFSDFRQEGRSWSGILG
jgi:hypothetical protein